MKIDQAPSPFRPITITLESREEATILARLIGRSSPAERQNYLADAGLAEAWGKSRGLGLHDTTHSFGRLHEATYSLGRLYRELKEAIR